MTNYDDGGFLGQFMALTKQQQQQHIGQQYERLTQRLARRLQNSQDPDDAFSQCIAQRHDACNRYIDIIPYDTNRVKLTDLGPADHDYINASWITYGPKRYIATQGPLPSTCGDFWRMVLEQDVQVVVCLTPEIERGRAKCAAYWPKDTAVRFNLESWRRRSFGHHLLSPTTKQQQWTILVEHAEPMTVDSSAACKVRTLRVTCEKDGEHIKTAIVYQLEYMGWADHGVPQNTQSLNALIQLANRLQQHGPMVVHCSAGCGRTGTFCVIDTALASLPPGDPVYQLTDVFRQQRTTMVQTPAQYLFCYHAIWDQLNSI